ncbi:hypothetical protein KIPB_007954 [Kipferlia bialata]|uniref:Uncharacterized protein n=1 Tax=Kipferlia bialata TaxID=797122 RepID=A0A9K3CY70_9EUKA|nr:hypothetical protein KIPB_005209 [Kipferlia bialata]GIQ86155.1 hypothetical protein KIPB_007954 [Kipferlia bialata]|eukprot:g5209.t1
MSQPANPRVPVTESGSGRERERCVSRKGVDARAKERIGWRDPPNTPTRECMVHPHISTKPGNSKTFVPALRAHSGFLPWKEVGQAKRVPRVSESDTPTVFRDRKQPIPFQGCSSARPPISVYTRERQALAARQVERDRVASDLAKARERARLHRVAQREREDEARRQEAERRIQERRLEKAMQHRLCSRRHHTVFRMTHL